MENKKALQQAKNESTKEQTNYRGRSEYSVRIFVPRAIIKCNHALSRSQIHILNHLFENVKKPQSN